MYASLKICQKVRMATPSNDIQLKTPCPDFSLKACDGKIRSLKDYSSFKVLVVGFTCNHCPYVRAYEDRINVLSKQLKGLGAALICINSNDAIKYPDDSFEAMQLRAKEKEFAFDYLHDESQEVAKKFNAACTPEFFVFDEKRLLQYHGRLDDNTHEPEKAKEFYIRDAVQALLEGANPKVQKTHALGCSIKWRLS